MVAMFWYYVYQKSIVKKGPKNGPDESISEKKGAADSNFGPNGYQVLSQHA